MFAPGVVALAVSVLVLIFFKDSPEAAGFAPLESSSKKKPVKEAPGNIVVSSDKFGILRSTISHPFRRKPAYHHSLEKKNSPHM